MKFIHLSVFLVSLLCSVTLVPFLSGQEVESSQRLVPAMPEQVADSLWWQAPPDSGTWIRNAMRYFQKPLAEFSLPDRALAVDEIDTVVSRVRYMGRYWVAYVVGYLSFHHTKYDHLDLIGGLWAFQDWLQQQHCLVEARMRELAQGPAGFYMLEPSTPPALHLEFCLRLQGRQDGTRVVSIEIPDDYRPLF